MRQSDGPRVRWERRLATTAAVVGLLLMAFSIATMFMSVEAPLERCVGSAASVAFDDAASARCRREATAQFGGGAMMAALFGGLVVVALVRRRRSPSGPAWSTPVDGLPAASASPDVVRRLRWRAAGGAVVLVVGMTWFVGAAVLATTSGNQQFEFERTGERGVGTVAAVDAGDRYGVDVVTVRYVVDGETRSGEVRLDDSSPVYRVGDEVAIVRRGSRMSIIGEENASAARVWTFVVLLLGSPLVVALGGKRVARSMHAIEVMRLLPWQEMPISVRRWNDGLLRRHTIRLRGGPSEGEGLLVRELWGGRAWPQAGRHDARVAGDEVLGFVLAPMAGATARVTDPLRRRGRRRQRLRRQDGRRVTSEPNENAF